MKIKIKPFMQRLIKENIVYILGDIFLVLLIIISIFVGLGKNFEYNSKNVALKAELTQLQNKITLMTTTIPSSTKLDEDVKFLNTLIPSVEDYFSIIYSLEKLSQKSNFVITSYTVNVTGSTSQKSKLSVTGQGDSQAFVNFLKNYNYGGGRLMTSDKIKVDPNFTGAIQIDLTFYTKAVSTGNNLEQTPNANVFQNLETLKSKVNFILDSNLASSTPDLNYPKKTNPF